MLEANGKEMECTGNPDSDWETDGESEPPEEPDSPEDDTTDKSEWFKEVIRAIKKRSAVELEALLQQPCTRKREIEQFADTLITTVAKAVCRKNLSKDLLASLEILMFVIVEFGKPMELVASFSCVFERDFLPNGSAVPFLLPNVRVTIRKLSKHRLFWLSIFLNQLDEYVGDFNWNGMDSGETTDYSGLVKLQTQVCDFVQPFVEEVRLDQQNISLPGEKSKLSEEEIVGCYRELLARSLLHLLSSPVAEFPVSYAKGFESYQRIVCMLGKIVANFSHLIEWMKSASGADSDMTRVPITEESIAKLAFLVRCCEVQPDHFPSPLSAEYYLFEILVPYSACHGQHQLTQHLNFLTFLLDRIPDLSLEFDKVKPQLLRHLGADLLGQAKYLQDEKARRRIYLAVQHIFSKMTLSCLHLSIRHLWEEEEIQKSPTIREVLLVALRKPAVEFLHGSASFDQPEMMDIFKMLLRTREFDAITDSSGLVASIFGFFTMVIGIDRKNRSGILNIMHCIEEYVVYWEKKVYEARAEMKLEQQKKAQVDGTNTADSLEEMQRRRCIYQGRQLSNSTGSESYSSSSSSSSSDDSNTSDSDDEKTGNLDFQRTLILRTAIEKEVPIYGWTDEALDAACLRCSYSPAAKGLFPEGPVALVVRAYETKNEKFRRSFRQRDTSTPKSDPLPGYFEAAIYDRLSLNKVDLNDWDSALAILAQPKNALRYLRLVGGLADDMWHLSGDERVDSMWYPRRALIAAIYQSTELFMLQDQSVEFSDTWEFLDRRMDEFEKLGTAYHSIEKPMGYLFPFLQSASVTMANITGLNQRRSF